MENKNFIAPELTLGKRGTIFFAFLLLFCFQFSGAQAYYFSTASCFGKYQQDPDNGKTGTVVSVCSGDTERLTASEIYDYQPSDSAENSPGNLPFPEIFSIDLPVDDIDTHQVKHILTTAPPIDPESGLPRTIVFVPFNQSPPENIILSHLRTIVLLH